MRNFKSRASKTMAIISVNTTQTGRQHIKQKQLLSNHKGCHATCQPMSWRVNLTTQQHKFDYKSERERKTKDLLLRLRPPLSQVNCWTKKQKEILQMKMGKVMIFMANNIIVLLLLLFLCSSINHGNC